MKTLALLVALILSATPLRAQPILVDLELAFMVDVSRSVSYHELEIQRRGYAAALRSDALADAVGSGAMGRIAITYVEWAGSQREIVPWTLIESREDLHAFADALTVTFNPTMRRTSISEALAYATAAINSNDYDGIRRVIDVSGDGPNNQGRHVEEMRDAAISQGIVINGLPLLTQDGLWSLWSIDDLDVYYRDCVIGGPGAFVVPLALPGDDITPGDDVVAFRFDGTRGLYIHPEVWHEGVFPLVPRQRFLDRQGRVHARVSVEFADEFGCRLLVPGSG